MSELISQGADILVAVCMILGAALMLLAAVGLIRLPDLPTRMHASTKAGSLGAALLMLAVAILLPEPAVIARVLATVVFLLLTAPVAAHAIGRAGYFVGVPLWEGTVKDDLAGHYDLFTHNLDSGDYADREPEGVEPFTKEEPKEEPIPLGPEKVDGALEPEEHIAPDETLKPVSDPDMEPEEEQVPTKIEDVETAEDPGELDGSDALDRDGKELSKGDSNGEEAQQSEEAQASEDSEELEEESSTKEGKKKGKKKESEIEV